MLKIEFIQEQKYRNYIGIYGIKNIINNKIYIGQTRESFIKRYWHHRCLLNNNHHDNPHLQNAWNKYGSDNFVFIIIEVVKDSDLIDDLEIQYISYYKRKNLSYNILNGGQGKIGVPNPPEICKRIGEINRKRMLGSKLSEETKRKMSQRRKGRYVPRNTDKLNEDNARVIKEMLVDGLSPRKIADNLKIDYKLVNNILSLNAWKHVRVNGWDEFQNNRKKYSRLSKEDHKEIYRLHIECGLDKYQLAEMYGKTVKMIEKVFRDQKPYDNPVPSLKQRKV